MKRFLFAIEFGVTLHLIVLTYLITNGISVESVEAALGLTLLGMSGILGFSLTVVGLWRDPSAIDSTSNWHPNRPRWIVGAFLVPILVPLSYVVFRHRKCPDARTGVVWSVAAIWKSLYGHLR